MVEQEQRTFGACFSPADESLNVDLAKFFGFARLGPSWGYTLVWRLDRLGRSLGQLMAFMQTLQSRQIGFQSLVEAIDTTTATGQFFFQITGAFAELERNLIRERTLAGLASARCRGRYGGRPRAIDPDTFQTTSRFPFCWCGMKPTVFGLFRLDEPPGPHCAQEEALDATASKHANTRGCANPIQSI